MPLPSPEHSANTILQVLQAYAQKNGLSPNFVQAAMAIASHESGFSPSATNDGRNFGGVGSEYSIGPWQINMKAHGGSVSEAQARDPSWSTQWRIPGLVQQWNAMGGDRAFQADPVGFQAKFHERVQVSIPLDRTMAGRALDNASRVMGGGGAAPVPYANAVGTGLGEGTPAPRPDPVTQSLGVPGAPVNQPALTPPSSAGAAESLLMQLMNNTLMRAADPSMNPFESKALVEQAAHMAGMVKNLQSIQAAPTTSYTVPGGQTYDNLPPDVAATLANQWGITGANISARLQEQREQSATQVFIASMNNNTTRDVAGARLGFDYFNAERDYNLGLQQLGLNRDQFAFNSMMALAQEGRLQRREDEERRQFDVLAGGTPFQHLQLGETRAQAEEANRIRREELGISRERMGLERETALGALGIDQQRLGIEQSQLGLQQQAGLRAERTALMGAYTDMLGQLISAGQITQRGAEKALDSLIEVYQMSPTTSGYLAGHEPGGAYATFLGRIGGNYDPGMYRMRPFPLDLETMAKLNGQFDASTAWKQAQEMVSGAMGNINAQIPAAGAGTMPGTTPPMTPPMTSPMAPSPQLPGPSPMSAALPSPAPQSPTPTAPVAPGMVPGPSAPQPSPTPQVPQTPQPSLPQPTVQPSPPPQPAAPPTCGPGYRRSWDGMNWTCVAG